MPGRAQTLAADVSCAATSLHSLMVDCFVWWSAMARFTSMCTLVVWSLTPFSTPGCVSVGLVILFDDGAGLVLGLSPVSKPGSYVAVLSGGALHQGFVTAYAGRRRLPCIVGLVGDAGVLCPLWLLDNLHNGGEMLSRNAFALCIMYLKPAM